MSGENNTIVLPVPMGTLIYTAETKCGDFCLFQKERFRHCFPRGKCAYDAPCHTYRPYASKSLLSYNNMARVINDWGTRAFTSEQQALLAAKTQVKKNIKTMKELGFTVDESGYSMSKERV